MSVLASLAVARCTSVPYRVRKWLLDQFGSAEEVLRESNSISSTSDSTAESLRRIRAEADRSQAEATAAFMNKIGGWILEYGQSGYPSLLAEIPDSPLVLFGRGQQPSEASVCLGVVGPRKPSPYGARVARLLSTDLAREGIVIVSGLARGIDAVAHESALQIQKPTIAVLGCGIDLCYPPEHAYLKDQIIASGTVMTEFFPREPARREHFPQRNRLVSGLSRGVLIVEAGERSGARITARHAVEQDREVFAVPGPIDAPLSFWPNRLISEGAKLVRTSDDILDEIFPHHARCDKKPPVERNVIELSSGEEAVLQFLTLDDPMGADDLARKGQLPIDAVLTALMELELKGVVLRQPDARYLRVRSM